MRAQKVQDPKKVAAISTGYKTFPTAYARGIRLSGLFAPASSNTRNRRSCTTNLSRSERVSASHPTASSRSFKCHAPAHHTNTPASFPSSITSWQSRSSGLAPGPQPVLPPVFFFTTVVRLFRALLSGFFFPPFSNCFRWLQTKRPGSQTGLAKIGWPTGNLVLLFCSYAYATEKCFLSSSSGFGDRGVGCGALQKEFV